MHFILQVEQEKRRAAAAAAAEKQAQAASTWWGWATGAGKAKSPEDAANQQDDMRANFTADEYSKLEDMVSEQEQAVKSGKARLVSIFGDEVASLWLENQPQWCFRVDSRWTGQDQFIGATVQPSQENSAE